MNQIPKIKVGMRVRVMQTDEMVENGLANKKGKVIEILEMDTFYGDECVIQFGDGSTRIIYSCSISEISR